MASVTIQKHTTQSACAGQCGHLYRENKNYSNREIDTKLSNQNMYVGSADTARKAIKAAIRDIDSRIPPKRIRADRKTVAELCFPAPREGMSAEETKRFAIALLGELCKMKNMRVVGGAVHLDEVHKYLDPDDKQYHVSRGHLHVFVVPDTEKGCNMKSWLTKARYRELNSLADRICERELGYPYQSGKKARSRGNVERMKEQSAIAARERAERERDMAREEARTAKAQTLEALRERDEMRVQADVERCWQDAASSIKQSPDFPKPLEELPAVPKGLLRDAKPERVVLSTEDYIAARSAYVRVNDGAAIAQHLERLRKSIEQAARENRINRIDAHEIAVDDRVKADQQRYAALKQELDKAQWQLKIEIATRELAEQERDAALSETNQARDAAKEMETVIRHCPKDWKRLQNRTKRARHMANLYHDAQKGKQNPGVCRDSTGNYWFRVDGKGYDLRELLNEYVTDCDRHGLSADASMINHLEQLREHEQEQDIDLDWDLSH